MKRALALLVFLLPCSVPAQTSSSHDLSEYVLNVGGAPLSGTILTSASHRLTLGSLGEPLVVASAELGGGFVVAYPPPGEVLNLRFTDASTLVWDAEASVGNYNLYRGSVTDPFDPGYGTCLPPAITGQTTSVTSGPSPGGIHFYLLTAENRLHEEGGKGNDSAGGARPNPVPCP